MRRDSARSNGTRQSAPEHCPEEDYGQGWQKLTDQGKVYLSKKEKNVFILEGTGAAGFSACSYQGAAEERSLLGGGMFTLTTELKCMPGDQCPDQHVHVLVDVTSVADLSSISDFCGVHLCFDSRELRVESHKQNSSKQTLFAQPNCALLRTGTYVSLALSMCEDKLSVSLNGVALTSNLPVSRPSPTPHAVGNSGKIGVAVYGRTRCYLRRFKVSALAQPPPPSPNAQSNALAVIPSSGRGQVRRSSSSTMSVNSYAGPPVNAAYNMFSAQGMSTGRDFASEEMELATLIERDIVVGDLNVRFDDIGGLDDAKRAINEAVVLPLIMPEFFTGIRKPWKGVLLFGPPGTGKTMLAKAVASCTENVTFFNCSTATLTSKWRGESEKLLRALFQTARARVPCILFFDEIDSLLSHRGSNAEHEASRRFKSEFLIHMDGLLSDAQGGEHPPGHLLLLATSNAPWDLDEALRRRLEKRIYIPLPDWDARKRMFEHNLKDISIASDVDVTELASRTEHYSGADIQLICRDASMNPMRRLVDGLSPAELVELRAQGKLSPDLLPVQMADFEAALDSVQPSVSPADTQRYFEWSQDFGSK